MHVTVVLLLELKHQLDNMFLFINVHVTLKYVLGVVHVYVMFISLGVLCCSVLYRCGVILVLCFSVSTVHVMFIVSGCVVFIGLQPNTQML